MRLSFAAALLQVADAAAAKLAKTGTTVVVGNVHYFVPPESVGSLVQYAPGNESDDFTPITVINTNSTLDEERFSSFSKASLEADDVIQPAFLEGW